MNELIKIENNKNYGLVVSSRIIAKELNKRHDHVIRDLEKILENPNLGNLIISSTYKVAGQIRDYKEYLLTKDGFTLYMFNIQGYNDFKMAYINKFNEIKTLLNKQHKEDYHTGSYITKKFNIKRNRTNETFTLLGLQTKGSTSMQPYVLTELGKKYGVERTYTNNKHQGYEIKWKDCVIEYIKENIKDIPIEWIKA